MATYIVHERQIVVVEYVVEADGPDHAKGLVSDLGTSEWENFIECEYTEIVSVEAA